MSQSSSMDPITLLSKNLYCFFVIEPESNMNIFSALSSITLDNIDNKVRNFYLIRYNMSINEMLDKFNNGRTCTKTSCR